MTLMRLRRLSTGVMPGLDPGIHTELRRVQPYGFRLQRVMMDRRVKPGDNGGAGLTEKQTYPRSFRRTYLHRSRARHVDSAGPWPSV
jgi:hypothetical protein